MNSARPRVPARTRALGCALVVLVLAACTSDRVVSADGSTSTSDSGAATTTGEATSTTTPSATTHATSDSTTTSPGSTDALFVPPPGDVETSNYACDLFTQDCPPGHKCMPWDAQDWGSWSGTRCVPIAEDPAAPGEPCHVEGPVISAIDDCELGAMCWEVDPKTNEGTCRAFCLGSETSLYCDDPGQTCMIGSDGVIVLCLPICDPLEQDCPTGEACYPIQEFWSCATDASGEGGAYGDPCEYINVCDPGLICLGASAAPPGLPCEGAAGCCTEICDLGDPAGDQQCTGAAEGQTCQPWYEEGKAPWMWIDVGACALPA